MAKTTSEEPIKRIEIDANDPVVTDDEARRREVVAELVGNADAGTIPGFDYKKNAYIQIPIPDSKVTTVCAYTDPRHHMLMDYHRRVGDSGPSARSGPVTRENHPHVPPSYFGYKDDKHAVLTTRDVQYWFFPKADFEAIWNASEAERARVFSERIRLQDGTVPDHIKEEHRRLGENERSWVSPGKRSK